MSPKDDLIAVSAGENNKGGLDGGRSLKKNKGFVLTPGSVGVLGFQQHDKSLPASLSFVLIDPLPKGIKIKFVVGDGFYAGMMRDGPQLTFTATKYLSAGNVITWVGNDRGLPYRMSVRFGKSEDAEVGFFTQLRLFPGEWASSAVIDIDLYCYSLVSSTLCTWNPTTRSKGKTKVEGIPAICIWRCRIASCVCLWACHTSEKQATKNTQTGRLCHRDETILSRRR
jgi:hypothetical protein